MRKDIEGPCKECQKRQLGCRETCQDPAFLESKRLKQLYEQERKLRYDARRVDRFGVLRRARSDYYKAKKERKS